MKTITLRPHHLLCLSFYKGKGYDGSFVDNMDKIAKAVKEKDCRVILTTEIDDICIACPNNQGVCTSELKSSKYDNAVIVQLNLDDYITNATPIPYNALEAEIKERIISKGLRQNICNDCQWTDLCK